MSLASLIQSDIGEVFLGTEDFAQPCIYRHGADSFNVNLIHNRPEPPKDGQFVGRFDDFHGSVSDLAIDGAKFLPKPLDEIEWTDPQGVLQTAIVFPRPQDVNQRAENCYRLSVDGRMVQVFTVDSGDVEGFRVTPNGGEPFMARGVTGVIRGQELVASNTTKLQMTSIYVLRSEFAKRGIESPPMMASVEAQGQKWALNMSETEWGAVLVKLALINETLVREYQARRNATV